jgi:heptaprenyl diphosphate synthase
MSRTRHITLTALLFAAAIILSLVEGVLPPLPIPGARFGLSNIPVMYALIAVGPGSSLTIALLKAGFALLTRGGAAGLLSLCGGVLSVGAMWLAWAKLRERNTYTLLSLCGAIAHNLGQWAAVSLLYAGVSLLSYLPLLLAAGVAAGLVTAVLLRAAMPVLTRFVPRTPQCPPRS